MSKIGKWFSRLKKRTTLKSVAKGVAKAAGALPVIGGVIQSAAEAALAATQKVKEAQAEAVVSAETAAATGTIPEVRGIEVRSTKTWWIIGGGIAALGLVWFIARKKR